MLPQLDKKMTMLLESELRHHDIGVTLGDGIECFIPTADALECHLKSGKVLKADFVVLSMGVRPDTQLARDSFSVDYALCPEQVITAHIARLVEFPGVGHAPTFIAKDQVAEVTAFLLG